MNLDFILLGMIGPTELILLFLIPGLSIIPFIFYLVTLQSTLNEVSFENRKIQPAQVWLSLIPLFGLIWQFIIVNRLADSLREEFNSRNILLDESRPGSGIGLAYCILFCCSVIPFLGFLTAVAGLICWIIYWVKINDYKLKLRQNYSTRI